MPICSKCYTGFDGSDQCPKCGKLYDPAALTGVAGNSACGSLAIYYVFFICMAASVLGALASLIGGICMMFKAEWVDALIAIFLATPYCIGQFLVFYHVGERYRK